MAAFRLSPLVCALVLLLAACSGVAGPGRGDGDLPRDPAIATGALGNGMRYVVRPNASPPGEVALRLVILAGSMHEPEGQEGAAHFLEHMAFRGTRLYPDGEIQRVLQNLGATLGTDANATTGPDATTFMINLPRNDAGAVSAGLRVLREMVEGAKLDPAALEVERGVVLAEERARHSPAQEMYAAQMKAQLGDHPYARPPIGTRAAVEAMDAAALRGFYDAYYRPSRAVLIVVGDVDAAALQADIAATFGQWAGRGQAGGDPAPVSARPPGPDVAAHVVPGLSDTLVQLQWFAPYRAEARTLGERRVELVDRLGAIAVSQRMEGLLIDAGRPARFASAASPGRIDGVWSGTTARASGVTDVARSLELIATASRQAATHGVSQDELDRAAELVIARAEQAASSDGAGPSAFLADLMADNATSDPVYVAPSDTLQIIREQAATITLEEVNAALRMRHGGEPALAYFGPEAPAGGEAGLRETLARINAAPVAPYAAVEVKAWPYDDFGAPGEVIERREVEDIGVTLVTFANGVRLSVKPTNFQKQDVLVRVRLGLGQIGMPRDRIDASDMGVGLWSSGGLGKLTKTEQARTLAGRRVFTMIRTSDDAYEIANGGGGFTMTFDLGLQLELMAAMVSDPGLRSDEWNQMMADADRSDLSATQTPSAVLAYNLPRLVHSGDLRWTYNTAEMRKGWTPEQAGAFIRPIIANAPLEVVIVGDVDVDVAIREAARTFGALAPRAESPEPAGLRDVQFPAGSTEPVRLTHQGRADQGMLYVAWPTGQGMYADLRDYRIAWVLSRLLDDHATLHFRSVAGATYSPYGEADLSRALPRHGFIGLGLEIAPDRMEKAMQDIETIARDLSAAPVPDEELQRTLGPRAAASRRDLAGSNSYWAQNLWGAHHDPARLDLFRTQVADYETITAQEVMDAAKRWLRPENALRMMVVPE